MARPYPYIIIMGLQLFDTIRKERPNDLNKVIPIGGDITSPELGISENDQACRVGTLAVSISLINRQILSLQALLFSNVSVVFHSAATVKFDEKLKLSVTINMLGTKRLVQLCHQMLQLDVSSEMIGNGSKTRVFYDPLCRPLCTCPRRTRIVIAVRSGKLFTRLHTILTTSYRWFNGCPKKCWTKWHRR